MRRDRAASSEPVQAASRRREEARRHGAWRGRAATAGVVAVVLAGGALIRATLPLPGSAPAAAVAPPTAALSQLAAVAPDVNGRAWLLRAGEGPWFWGEAGSPARHQLADGETGLAVDGGWIASSMHPSSAVTSVVVRTRATGKTVASAQVPFWVASATSAPGRLLLTGYGDASQATSAGVVSMDPATGTLATLVPGGPFPAALGAEPLQGGVFVSGSGRTAATYACGPSGCTTTVIDLGTGATWQPTKAEPGFLRAVTDSMVVLTDEDGAWVKALDARTGKVLWTIADASLMFPVSMADGAIAADLFLPGRGWTVRSITAQGATVDLAPVAERHPEVWQQASSPTTVVYGPVSFGEALDQPGGAVGTLIRDDGTVVAASITIAPAQ